MNDKAPPFIDEDPFLLEADAMPALQQVFPEPLRVIRVGAASARAFELKAGQFIQVIDVEGRQCSDLLAFDAAALAAGEEWGLDPTVTRTLAGSSYPMPGLHAKYFDARMQPLLETVQDTVGRHDAFALACTAKYYEDQGFPGHANCSDNFNAVLEPMGVRPRAGWPAINFFYNTFIQPCGSLGFAEPWSKAGDYVLLRALKDLVVAVSSCADDIDPANAWQPTDIEVRVYDAAHSFPRAMAHRMTPDAPVRLTRPTAFAGVTETLTRDFIDYHGFWLPRSFVGHGTITEYWACREKVAVMDLTALRKFDITGPDAEALLQKVVTRDMRKLAVGQVVYTAVCHAHGGMMDDGTVFRLGRDVFRFVCGEDTTGLWLKEQAAAAGFKVHVRDATDSLHNIAVQGPRSRELLAKILWTAPAQPGIAELGWFRFMAARLGGPTGRPLVVSRTGYTGELGFELWCHPDDGIELWNVVAEAGAPLGLVPLGFDALDMLRIEAGLAFAGQEFCDQTDPFEAGIGFTVALSKPDDFIGRAALEERKAHPRRKLVGLAIDSNEAVHHGDGVYIGRARVGEITSAVRSPVLNAQVALARVDVACSELDTALQVGQLDGHRKRLAARVVAFPHYDPTKSRVRS
tara:strand:+ start:6707 stop:8602 length:1896 start_codon:yes stop_codon:yes gene_type:complete